MIDRVEHLNMEQKEVVIPDGYPLFEWLGGLKMEEDTGKHE